MTTDSLACVDFTELITAFLDGALPPDQRLRCEEHLAGCPGCRHYLEQMRTTIRLLGGVLNESVPPEIKQQLVEQFRRRLDG